MQLPVCVKKTGQPLPELAPDEVRHVIADNGVFLERRSAVVTACTRVPAATWKLDAHQPSCRLHIGQLPRSLHRVMLGFFRTAHGLHGGEAALVLLYHPEQRTYRWHCPEQTVEVFVTPRGWFASDRIEFENPRDLPAGYLQLGDAHLHPHSPEPSAIDLAEDQDGLHLIVGHIQKDPTYHIDFVVDRVRFQVPPAWFFEDPQCQPFEQVPHAWLRRIRVRQVMASRWDSE